MSTQASEFEVQPESRRPDGSLRPEVRRKKGYVPPEEADKFRETKLDTSNDPVPGSDGSAPVAAAASKTAAKNQRRNAKRKEEQKLAAPAEQGAKEGAKTNGAPVVEAAAAVSEPAAPTEAAAAPKRDKGSKAAEPAAEPVSELEKKLKALRKRLRQIEDLAEKQASGTVLNADQQAKVASKGEIAAEIGKWETLGDVDIQKKIKGLKKKMGQIEDLEKRQQSGEALNADQLGKVEGKSKLVDELAVVEALLAKL